MTRVDLDAVQARYEQAADLGGAHELAPHNYHDLRRSWSDVPALVAELRAAREVDQRIGQLLDAAEFLVRNDNTTDAGFVLAELIMDIRGVLVSDQAVGP